MKSRSKIQRFKELIHDGPDGRFIKCIKITTDLIETQLYKKKKLRMQYKKIFSKTINNPNKVIWIPTNIINKDLSFLSRDKYKYKYGFDFRYKNFEKNRIKIRATGVILDGKWDYFKEIFDHSIILIAFKERFIEKKEWKDTLYCKHFFNSKDQNKIASRIKICTNFREFKEKYLMKWDKLYEDIKNNGYKSQKEIAGGKPQNEIEVVVSRDGEILFIDGRHRLSIAKILGIKEVPVIVNVWHKEYIDWVKNNDDIKNIEPEMAIKPIIEKLKD